MAALCWACTSRRAMLARNRVMGTRRSTRSATPSGSNSGAAAGAASGSAALGWRPGGGGVGRSSTTYCATSSLVMRPSRPVPCTRAMSRPCSSASFRAAGLALTGSAIGGAVSSTGSSGAATSPGSKVASNSSLATMSPSCLTMRLSLPSAGATTSRTTLSVSMSTSRSSRRTDSPGPLCQTATVPSVIDSGKVGALISMAVIRRVHL